MSIALNIRRTLGRRAAATAAAAALLLCGAGTALAQDKITAVHAFPASWVYSKSFLEFAIAFLRCCFRFGSRSQEL